MIADECGVSEILGYTVLVAVVSIAAVGLMSAGMGTLQAAEKSMEFSGVSGSLSSLAQSAITAAETNNSFYSVRELSVPQDYELEVLDANDDSSSMKVYSDGTLLTSLRLGGIRIRSPFRSVTYEGGAITSNDTGHIQCLRSPSVRLVGSPGGQDSLYIDVISVMSDTFTKSGGPVSIGIRCDSIQVKKVNTGGSVVTIEITGDELSAWERELRSAGFSVAPEDGSLTAVSSEVSGVYVTCANVEFERV